MFLLLTNGQIKNGYDAILIAKGKVVEVGKSEVLTTIVGKNSKIIDLNGRSVIPGLIDSHTHLVPYGMELLRPNLKDAKSPDEAIDLIKRYIQKHQPNGVIIAQGYDDSNWQGSISKKQLDSAFYDYPVAVRRICGHKTIVNGKALDLIPPNTEYVNWNEGILLEKPSLYLNQIFPSTDAEIDQAMNLASKQLLSFGITTIHDITTSRYLRCFFKYKGQRPRIRAYLMEKDGKSLAEAGIRSGFGDDDLRVMGIKIFLDGSIGARTAALSTPYLDTNSRGRILINKRRLQSWLKLAQNSSLQLMIHAIGDRAIRHITDLPILKGNPLRHRIEHAEIIDDDTMKKIEEKNLLLSCQPNFVHQWGRSGGLYERTLGLKRSKKQNRLRSIIDKGIKLGLGTDLMPPDPQIVIEGALNHINPEEQIDFDTVIHHYTVGSAYLAFDENCLGEIREGKLADLTILDQKEGFKVYMVIKNGSIINL